VIVVSGFSLAACGRSSTPGVAAGTTTTTTTADNPSGNGSTGTTALLHYSACVRAHGVPNFPDPSSIGGIPKVTAQQLEVGQSELQAAQNDCHGLLPPGGSLSGQANQSISSQQQQYYLKVASCMHAHGVINFPEPSFYGGSVDFQGLGHLPGFHSLLFTHAFHVCQKLIPPGLPFSSPSGG
jgi:hypothetical protein